MSELIIDKLTGRSTVGSITVQGEGTATTNMQQGLSKAWLNMDGTGTISVRGSLNVTGLTDVGTGQYKVNISSSMTNANYAVAIGSKDNAYGCQNFTGKQSNSTQTTSLFAINSYNGSHAYEDNVNYMASLHGDLA